MQKVWNISEQHYGFKSESCGLVYLETAKIYGKKEDWPHAIEMQIRAINVFQELKQDEPEQIAEL